MIHDHHNRKELSRLYNEERLVDKSRVSCLKWVQTSSLLVIFKLSQLMTGLKLAALICALTRWAPGRQDTFLVAHASGQLYTYQVWIQIFALLGVWIRLNKLHFLLQQGWAWVWQPASCLPTAEAGRGFHRVLRQGKGCSEPDCQVVLTRMTTICTMIKRD